VGRGDLDDIQKERPGSEDSSASGTIPLRFNYEVFPKSRCQCAH